jgi:hypothetical protein
VSIELRITAKSIGGTPSSSGVATGKILSTQRLLCIRHFLADSVSYLFPRKKDRVSPSGRAQHHFFDAVRD